MVDLLERDAGLGEDRRSGSGWISADVLSEMGIPGHAARTARIAAAHGSASKVCLPWAS